MKMPEIGRQYAMNEGNIKVAEKGIQDYISYCQVLSEEFIEKHSDKLDWRDISWSQKLSEKFIEKHSNKIDWKEISEYQNLSEEFIKEMKSQFNTDLLKKYS